MSLVSEAHNKPQAQPETNNPHLMQRDYNLDLLRILACFMVILLHTSAHNWREADVAGDTWFVFNLLDVATRSAVPLFFMLSGKLFLSKPEISLSKLFRKNIWKLLVVYFIWSLLYAIDTISLSGFFTLDGMYDALILMLQGSKVHLWYLPSLIGVYFMIPVLWTAVHYKEGKFLKYICLMFFIFSIAKNTLLAFYPNSTTLNALASDFSFTLANYCGYFVFGYSLSVYIQKLKALKNWHLVLLYLSTVLVSAVLARNVSISAGEPIDFLYGYTCLPAFVEGTAIFVLFLRLSWVRPHGATATLLTKLSKYTLFIYLFHIFILEHFEAWFGISTLSFNAWISVPVIALVIFLMCVIAAAVLDKIPFLRKWMM